MKSLLLFFARFFVRQSPTTFLTVGAHAQRYWTRQGPVLVSKSSYLRRLIK